MRRKLARRRKARHTAHRRPSYDDPKIAIFQPLWVACLRGGVRETGEIRLLQAIVEDAVLLAFGERRGRDSKHGGGACDEATEWIESDEHRAFSFRYCCDVLGLDGGAVREAVARSRSAA